MFPYFSTYLCLVKTTVGPGSTAGPGRGEALKGQNQQAQDNPSVECNRVISTSPAHIALARKPMRYRQGAVGSSPPAYMTPCILQENLCSTFWQQESPAARSLDLLMSRPAKSPERSCPIPIKQRQNELRKRNFFVSLPLRCRLLILVDSCAEWGWPDTLGTIQGVT